MKNQSATLISPRVTEKAARLSDSSAYVFNVAPGAHKAEIAAEIKRIYKVTPRKVTLVAVPRKTVVNRATNRMGATAAGKKAYVYLKKGDKIELA